MTKEIEEQLIDEEVIKSLNNTDDLKVHIGKDKQTFIDMETICIYNSLTDEQFDEYLT